MEIVYGQHLTPAAVLNLVSGEVYSLDGVTSPPVRVSLPKGQDGPTAEMFAYLGGEQHSSNAEGGKGWIPDDQGFMECGVLRIDHSRPKLPRRTPLPDGRRILVTAQNRRVDAWSQVIIVQESEVGTEVFFVPNRATAVRMALTESNTLRKSLLLLADRTLQSYGTWGENKTQMVCKEKKVQIYGAVATKLGQLSIHRVLDLIFWRDLYCHGSFRKQTPWEGGLGIVTGVDGAFYFNSGGILRAPVKTSKPFTEQFPWPTFITDPRPGFSEGDLYLLRRQGKRTLNGRYQLREGKGGSRFVVEISVREMQTMARSGVLLPKYVDTLMPPPAT